MCFISPACLPPAMYSLTNDAALPAPGFPIRRSAGQRLFSASPRLIAAVHVLLRLLVPRHPPCALTILTVSSFRAREHGRCCTPPRANARTAQIPFFWPLCSFQASSRPSGGGLPPAVPQN